MLLLLMDHVVGAMAVHSGHYLEEKSVLIVSISETLQALIAMIADLLLLLLFLLLLLLLLLLLRGNVSIYTISECQYVHDELRVNYLPPVPVEAQRLKR